MPLLLLFLLLLLLLLGRLGQLQQAAGDLALHLPSGGLVAGVGGEGVQGLPFTHGAHPLEGVPYGGGRKPALHGAGDPQRVLRGPRGRPAAPFLLKSHSKRKIGG